MEYKYTLQRSLVDKIAKMSEFANGGAQVRIRTKDGVIHEGILVSNCMYVIAMRGHSELPFDLEDIEEVFQTEEDKNPVIRGGWEFWDDWSK